MNRILRIALVVTSLMVGSIVLAPGVAANPTFNPANFSGHAIDNAWFPLRPGTLLVYKGVKDGKNGTDIVHVTKRTRWIGGVLTTVVEDTTTLNGRLSEHTLDFYAQDNSGNVWYLGERTAEYDRNGNIVSREGSWQTGVNGAEPGIFMPADPHVGDSYRQEYLPGHAEDHFKIVDLDASVNTPYASFRHALRTREWTPLEPGVRDAKFYVKGIGEVAELAMTGPREVFKLVQVGHS